MSDPRYDLTQRLSDLGDLSDLTILNLGAGKSDSLISNQLPHMKLGHITNVEIFPPYAETLRGLPWHSSYEVVEYDITEYVRSLPNKSYDVVLLLDVLEHLDKFDAELLLSRLLHIARKRVLIFLPIGYCKQDPYDGNEYQRHLSTWEIEDFPAGSVEFMHLIHGTFSAGWVRLEPKPL